MQHTDPTRRHRHARPPRPTSHEAGVSAGHDTRATRNDREPDTDRSGRHPMYRELEERRAHPRVKLRLPIQLGLSDGRAVCARIYNLSPDGLQIRCEPDAALAINPSGRVVAPGDGPQVLVVMRLDTGNDTHTLVVRCRVSYVLPESPSEVIMGLSFEDLPPAQRRTIDAALRAGAAATPA